jgi:hypothetical protein
VGPLRLLVGAYGYHHWKKRNSMIGPAEKSYLAKAPICGRLETPEELRAYNKNKLPCILTTEIAKHTEAYEYIL